MPKAVALSAKDLNPVKRSRHSAMQQRGAVESVPMQFRMAPEFVRAFKQAALDHDMKLNELLKLCFHEFMKRER